MHDGTSERLILEKTIQMHGGDHGMLHYVALGVATRHNPAWHMRTCLARITAVRRSKTPKAEPRAEQTGPRGWWAWSRASPRFLKLGAASGSKEGGAALDYGSCSRDSAAVARVFGSAESGDEKWLIWRNVCILLHFMG
jgi:hypothetical protein